MKLLEAFKQERALAIVCLLALAGFLLGFRASGAEPYYIIDPYDMTSGVCTPTSPFYPNHVISTAAEVRGTIRTASGDR